MSNIEEQVIYDLQEAINQLKKEIKNLTEEVQSLRRTIRDNTDALNS